MTCGTGHLLAVTPYHTPTYRMDHLVLQRQLDWKPDPFESATRRGRPRRTGHGGAGLKRGIGRSVRMAADENRDPVYFLTRPARRAPDFLARFAALCKGLALAVAPFAPDAILGSARWALPSGASVPPAARRALPHPPDPPVQG